MRTASDLKRYWPLAAVASVVLLLDQWSKAAVTSYLSSHNDRPVLGGLAHLDLVHNTGAAFGLLPNQTYFFIAIAVAIIASLVISYHRLAEGPVWLRLGLGLVLGGALGNLVDRIRLGYVVDFVDLRWWPVFNLADSCIVVGVSLLVITMMLQPAATREAADVRRDGETPDMRRET